MNFLIYFRWVLVVTFRISLAHLLLPKSIINKKAGPEERRRTFRKYILNAISGL